MIKEKILDLIAGSVETVTPSELEKRAMSLFSVKRKEVKDAVKSLISEGHLSYACTHGRTVIGTSFNRPVRVSEHIVLKPAGMPFTPEHGDAVVELVHGASFGTGEHPTTRLAIRGIAYILKERRLSERKPGLCMLDIGTGSGILAITAIKLGAESAAGLDTDPCSLYEARANAVINGLEDKFHICGCDLGDINESFDLIAANLRYPTLKTIVPHIVRLTRQEAWAAFSGIKSEEVSDLTDAYTKAGFDCVRNEHEKNWAGLVFFKSAKK